MKNFKNIILALILSLTSFLAPSVLASGNVYDVSLKCGETKSFTVANIPDAKYTWTLVDNFGNVIFEKIDNSTRNVCDIVIPEEEGLYKLTVVADVDGCKEELENRILASKIKMDLSIDGKDWLCETQSTLLSVEINSASSVNGVSYQWFKDDAEISGATNKTYLANEVGIYKVKVTVAGTSVSFYETKDLTEVKELPFLEVEEEAQYKKEAEIVIGNNADWDNDRGYTYEWSVKQEGTNLNVKLPSETDSKIDLSKIDKAGIFTVKASDKFCSVEASINVIRWYNVGMPTGFRPSKGEKLTLVGNQQGIESVKLQIFDRNGVLVYEALNADDAFNSGWNGKYNGDDQRIDGYVYFLTVNFDNGEILKKKGSVSLLR
ncbi:hypothetical protein E0494_02285 [Marinilabiliaceae bacterium JC040]|nr:hypothetical protein [Marinilabiliaceae bacterium JC040]